MKIENYSLSNKFCEKHTIQTPINQYHAFCEHYRNNKKYITINDLKRIINFDNLNCTWSMVEQSQYIESIILNVVKPIYYVQEDNNYEYLIPILCQNEIYSILNFINGDLTLSQLQILSTFNGLDIKSIPAHVYRMLHMKYVDLIIFDNNIAIFELNYLLNNEDTSL